MNNHFGIWLAPGLASAAGIANNAFVNVAIPIQQ